MTLRRLPFTLESMARTRRPSKVGSLTDRDGLAGQIGPVLMARSEAWRVVWFLPTSEHLTIQEIKARGQSYIPPQKSIAGLLSGRHRLAQLSAVAKPAP